jgi:uncharacterized membrane protein (UPF0127 family)
MKKLIFIVLLESLILAAGVKMIPLYIHEYEMTVEVADTPAKQAKGLMFRDHIPDDFGMLFVFPDERTRSFWMKNCRINLDIIYLNRAKQVVDIHQNVPPCRDDPCPTYVSKEPAQYVLELRGNRADELKIKLGDTLFFIYNGSTDNE